MKQMYNFQDIASKFRIIGDYQSCEPYGSGHIHETYLLSTRSGIEKYQYILQRLNTLVFKHPEEVMENIKYITEHLSGSPQDELTGNIAHLKTYPATNGKLWFSDPAVGFWRCYHYLSNTITFNSVDDSGIAYEGARMFGAFVRGLSGIEPGNLYITIPDFHNIQKRLANLDAVIGSDVVGRKSTCLEELEKIRQFNVIASAFESIQKHLPVRVTHNDTKINNVLFDAETLKGICVIDLDTVMPGTVLSDFGDMVRTFTNSADEDEKELKNVHFRINIFDGLARGFLEQVHDILKPVERNNLVTGAKLLIFMQAVRFLTDYLEGDVYYKTEYPDHNLVRTKNQLKLLESFIEQEEEAEELIARSG